MIINHGYCLNNNIYIIDGKMYKDAEFFIYNIRYPILVPFASYFGGILYNPMIIDKINKTIYNNIMSFKNELKKQAKEYGKEYANVLSKSKEDYVKYQYEAYVGYKVTYNKNNVMSIPIKKYEFTGGAHGMTYLDSYNYNLNTGYKLKLSDLFIKNIDYKNIVNSFIKDSISKDPEKYFEGDEGFKGISDNQQFYIENDGVVVYFNLYDIAPYYVGIPKFKLSFKDFRQYFNHKYIC